MREIVKHEKNHKIRKKNKKSMKNISEQDC
jgi:hypothetical protein